MDYVGLGRRLRAERKRHRMTQEDLAEKVGISLSFLGHIERGSRKASIETLVNIANALEISLDYLLEDSLHATSNSPVQVQSNQKDLLMEINRLIESGFDKWDK